MDAVIKPDGSAPSMLKIISPSVIEYLLILVAIIIFRLLIGLFQSGYIASQKVNLTDTLAITAIWVVGWAGVCAARKMRNYA